MEGTAGQEVGETTTFPLVLVEEEWKSKYTVGGAILSNFLPFQYPHIACAFCPQLFHEPQLCPLRDQRRLLEEGMHEEFTFIMPYIQCSL